MPLHIDSSAKQNQSNPNPSICLFPGFRSNAGPINHISSSINGGCNSLCSQLVIP